MMDADKPPPGTFADKDLAAQLRGLTQPGDDAEAPGASAPSAEPGQDVVVVAELTPEQHALRQAARQRRRLRRRRAERRRRIRRSLITVSVVLALIAVAVFVWLRYTFGGLERIPTELSAANDTPGTTILLVGSDPGARGQVSAGDSWRRTLGHSDLVMLMHVPADRQALYSISIPSDARVQVPGSGQRRLAEVFELGEEQLYIRTVQRLTETRIDHLAVLDFNGLREVADLVGGIEVTVPSSACGDEAGVRRMDGEQALEFMQLRRCLPRADLDRVARQQAVVKALLAATLDGGTLANPFQLNRIARSTFNHLSVEQDWGLFDIAGLAWQMRGTRPRTTTFLTAPTLPSKARRTVRLNAAGGAALWKALRTDTLSEYVQLYRGAATGQVSGR